MNRCPITCEPIGDDAVYSRSGLSLLSRNLRALKPFPYSVDEQLQLASELAASAGLDIPVHGLAWGKDGRLFYFIKRFDRMPSGQKIALEDFAQLAGMGIDDTSKFSSR